jgi:putative transposase
VSDAQAAATLYSRTREVRSNEVIDCADRSVVGRCISKRCRAQEAIWALEDACLKRFGVLARGNAGLVVRSDNGLVFASKKYRELFTSYGLTQEFIHPHTPEQNGVVEAYHKTFKRECVWQHRLKTLEEATAVISTWIDRYNTQRPLHALAISRRPRGTPKTPPK